MKHVIEFVDDNGRTRHTEAFNSLETARLARIFMPWWLETRIVPEAEIVTQEGEDRDESPNPVKTN